MIWLDFILSVNYKLNRPKRGTGNMMVDYLEAEKLGQADPEACSSAFSGCPVSLFNMMRTYSTPADKPHDHQHSRDDSNQHNQKGGKRADSSVQDDSGRLDLVEDRNGMDDIISLDMFWDETIQKIKPLIQTRQHQVKFSQRDPVSHLY